LKASSRLLASYFFGFGLGLIGLYCIGLMQLRMSGFVSAGDLELRDKRLTAVERKAAGFGVPYRR
jgi:hypothetical protein